MNNYFQVIQLSFSEKGKLQVIDIVSLSLYRQILFIKNSINNNIVYYSKQQIEYLMICGQNGDMLA